MSYHHPYTTLDPLSATLREEENEMESEYEDLEIKPEKEKKDSISPKTCQIYVVFLRCDEKAMKHAKNRYAAWYTQSEWVHCEIYFPKTSETCSIDTKNPVYFMQYKNYSNRDWVWYKINVTESKYNRLRKVCAQSVGDQFDMWSLLLFWMPAGCCFYPSRDRWLCSKLVATKLKDSELIPSEINTAFVTPKDLIEILQSHGAGFVFFCRLCLRKKKTNVFF